MAQFIKPLRWFLWPGHRAILGLCFYKPCGVVYQCASVSAPFLSYLQESIPLQIGLVPYFPAVPPSFGLTISLSERPSS